MACWAGWGDLTRIWPLKIIQIRPDLKIFNHNKRKVRLSFFGMFSNSLSFPLIKLFALHWMTSSVKTNMIQIFQLKYVSQAFPSEYNFFSWRFALFTNWKKKPMNCLGRRRRVDGEKDVDGNIWKDNQPQNFYRSGCENPEWGIRNQVFWSDSGIFFGSTSSFL